MSELLNRITINPDIRFGKPTVTGTRIAVEDILELLAGGESRARIIEEYELEDADISAALLYAARAIAPKTAAAE